MGALTLDQNIISFFMVFIAVVVGIQAYLQLRIKNVLQALTMNADSVVHNIRKIAGESKKNSTPDQAVSNTCQFCKHRLAFINIDKNNNPEEELSLIHI